MLRRAVPWYSLVLACTPAACGGDSTDTPVPVADAGVDVAPPPPPPRKDAGVDAAASSLVDLGDGEASLLDAETAIAAAPNGWLLSVWTVLDRSGGSATGYAFSKDNGATWTAPQSLLAPGALSGGDPIVTADAQSNFYVGYLGIDTGAGEATGIYVQKAAAGQTTFAAPVTVSEPAAADGGASASVDKPWIVVTPAGTVVVIYTEFSATDAVLVVARSTNGGQTWTRTRVGAGDGGYNRVRPCASGNRLWMSAMGFAANVTVVTRWSDDDGETWPAANKTVVPEASEADVAYVDPNMACNGNDVWILYGNSPDPLVQEDTQLLTKIRLAHSGDGGKTIDWRKDVHDTTAGRRYVLPEMVREPGGAIDLVYYAGTQAEQPGTFRRARSSDQGQSFAPSVAIDDPIVFTGKRAELRWLGDYVGLTYAGGKLSTSFAHNNVARSRVYYHGATVP